MSSRCSLAFPIHTVLVALAIFYSMADYSTTPGPILILFPGGYWARRQLPNGIRYVSVASRLMNPPTLLRVVFLKVHELDGRLHHNHLTDSGSDYGRLLGSTPATQRYDVPLCRINTLEVAHPCQSGLYKASTLAIPELDGRFLHSHCSDPGSDCMESLSSTPTTRRYKVRR